MNENTQDYDALLQRLTSVIWSAESRSHYYRAQGQTIYMLMNEYWNNHPECLEDEPQLVLL